MNLRNWSGRTLTMAREVFPNSIDLTHVHLETRSGDHAGDPGYKRHMGRNSRNKVRRFLIEAGLGTFDHRSRTFTAEPPPSGTARQPWITNAYRDVTTALKDQDL